MNKLPKNWCIRGCEELATFINVTNKIRNRDGSGYSGNGTMSQYAPSNYNNITGSWDYSGQNYWINNKTEITFKEFEELVLKKGKKIIGYKAPYNIYNNTIIKGDIFKLKFNNIHSYQSPDTEDTLPKEIVETWEPVFAEEDIKIGEYVVEIVGCEAIIEGFSYKKWELEQLRNIMDTHKNQIKSLNVGCSGQYKVDLLQICHIIKQLT